MSSIRVYSDFNNREEDGRVRLNTKRSRKDLRKHRLTRNFEWGRALVVHDDEIECAAKLERGPGDNWLAKLDGEFKEIP